MCPPAALEWRLGSQTRTVIRSPGCFGRVAEWQTRWLQVPVSFGTWGFKSPFAHRCFERGRVNPSADFRPRSLRSAPRTIGVHDHHPSRSGSVRGNRRCSSERRPAGGRPTPRGPDSQRLPQWLLFRPLHRAVLYPQLAADRRRPPVHPRQIAGDLPGHLAEPVTTRRRSAARLAVALDPVETDHSVCAPNGLSRARLLRRTMLLRQTVHTWKKLSA